MLLEQALRDTEYLIIEKAESIDVIREWMETINVFIDHRYIDVKMTGGSKKEPSDKVKDGFDAFVESMGDMGLVVDDWLVKNHFMFHVTFMMGNSNNKITDIVNDVADHFDDLN